MFIGFYKGANNMSNVKEINQSPLKVINKYKTNGETFQKILQRTINNKKINNYRIIAKEILRDEQNL